MNKRLIGVLVFALAVAGAASYLVYRFLGAALARSAAQQPSVELTVAARNLQSGDMIKEVDLKTESWTQPVPPTAINDRNRLIGRGVLYPIVAGEPILEERLAPEGAGAGLPALIPPGMRAVAIPVNNVSGLGGFVTPGTRVDVLVMGDPPNMPRSLGTLSKTLLQNIEVLSAGTQTQRDAEGKPIQVPVLNLLVTPEQAEMISLASSQARIQLVLRNPLDKEEAKTQGVAFARLFTGQAGLPAPQAQGAKPRSGPAAAPAPRPAFLVSEPRPKPEPIVVEILIGSRKSSTKFEPVEPEKTEKQETGTP